MLKKLSRVLLVLAMLLWVGIPGIAQAVDLNPESTVYQNISQDVQVDNAGQFAVSQENALEILKNAFPGLTRGKTFELNHDVYYDDSPAWRFLWRDPEYRPAANTTSRITATINAQTGELTQFFYRPDPLLYKGKNAVFSRDEAFEIAEDFLHKMQPDKLNMLDFKENDASYSPDLQTTHYFHWTRVADGIPVGWDGMELLLRWML